jgi:hypothetical protein
MSRRKIRAARRHADRGGVFLTEVAFAAAFSRLALIIHQPGKGVSFDERL